MVWVRLWARLFVGRRRRFRGAWALAWALAAVPEAWVVGGGSGGWALAAVPEAAVGWVHRRNADTIGRLGAFSRRPIVSAGRGRSSGSVSP